MLLKAYTGFSDRQLVEHLDGNVHYQLFCGIMISPSSIDPFRTFSLHTGSLTSRTFTCVCLMLYVMKATCVFYGY
ncbi:MAG: transposase [Bacteroides xylanisolvens]